VGQRLFRDPPRASSLTHLAAELLEFGLFIGESGAFFAAAGQVVFR